MTESPQVRQGADYAVGILFPCGSGYVPWQTSMALTKTAHLLARLGIPVNIYAVAGSSLVTVARNHLLDRFLAGTEQYAFWIDADIVWEPEDFIRVLRLAKELGVACAAYPIKQEPERIILNFVEEVPQANQFGCVEIYGTGLGFTCLRRPIMEELRNTKLKVYHPGNDIEMTDAFRLDNVPRGDQLQSRGEDMAFFADVRALGHKIWLDPTINLGHVGMKVYRVTMEEAT